MSIWKQLLVALCLFGGAAAAWAAWTPSGASMLVRLGLAEGGAQASVGGPAQGGGPGAGGQGGAGGPGGFGGGGPTLVSGAAPGEGLANARVSAIGDARSLASVDVTPLEEGRLDAVEVVSGATVREGQTIARLDSELEAIALERARIAREDAEATLARVEQLVARGAATDVQLREARLALDQARLEERDAALALDRRTVRAPIDGVVGLVPVERGQRVGVETVILTIEDRSSLRVDFRVPERAAALVKVGDPVAATPLARPESTLEGRVAALDNRIDPESRTLAVQATLPNADDRLRAGMAFAIEMRLPGEPFPEVDALAIQWSSDGAFVWVGRDGEAARVPVRIVQRNGDRVLVAAAFEPGDRVIAEGVQRLRPGGAVRFVGDPPPPAASGADVSRVEKPVSGG